MGTTLVGSPDTVARGIERLIGYSKGGVGGILFRANEWADWEQTRRSYELFARWVMPRFQGSLETVTASRDWAREKRRDVFAPNVEAIRKAYTDAGRDVPAQFTERLSGARDAAAEPIKQSAD
jgi:limonene 1,2-monooxygenase